MDLHIDHEELQYICTTVFPNPNSAKILNNQHLIHYQPSEPEYGDRFVQTDLPDYEGNDPYRFFTLNQEKIAKMREELNAQIQPKLPGMTLQRNYVLADNAGRRADVHAADATGWLLYFWLLLRSALSLVFPENNAEALNALDDAIDAGSNDDNFKEVVDEQRARQHTAEPEEPSEVLEQLTEQHHYQNLYSDQLQAEQAPPPVEHVEAERPRAMSRDPVQSDSQLFGTSTVIEKIDGEVIAQIDFPTAMPMQFYSPELHLDNDDFHPHVTVDGEPVAAPRSSSTLSSGRSAKLAAINREVLEVTKRHTPPNTPDAGVLVNGDAAHPFDADAVSSKLEE